MEMKFHTIGKQENIFTNETFKCDLDPVTFYALICEFTLYNLHEII